MPRCPNPRCQTDYPAGTILCTNPFCQCFLPEAVVAGRYRIETLIGLGGMGMVYRVSDTFEMDQVALKVLSLAKNALDIPTAVERFRREARYAHQLKHRNIVTVLNFGQDGDHLFLVMPLITGGTLKELLKAEQALPVQQMQRYVNDIAGALDVIHAHPQQIVHRDIKPSNLLLHQDDGRLVLADFGIARAMQQEKPLTQRGWALGTEHYIAPEQEQGKVAPVSDVYAMGVVAYQMATGLLPFKAIVKGKASSLPLPTSLNPDLPATVDPVIMRAMEVNPKQRYQTGGEFARALNEALTIIDIASAPTIAAPMPVFNSTNVITKNIMLENLCWQCGRENRGSSRFCRHCGRSLEETMPILADACQAGYSSVPGRKALRNEDMLLLTQGLCINLMPPPYPFGLFAIADGLRSKDGSYSEGDKASRLAIETVADVIVPLLTDIARSHSRSTPTFPPKGESKPSSSMSGTISPEIILEHWIKDGVQQANKVIYHCNADLDQNMTSTLTVALVHKQRLYVANVGDSRAYLYNPNRGLSCLTKDHTLAAHLVEANLLTPEEVYKSSKRHRHYRSLGTTYQIIVDFTQHPLEPDDLILLCTDGLWHSVHDQRIEETLARGNNPQALASTLVDEALRVGGEGNISALVLRVQ